MHGAGDLELGELLDALMDAGRDLVVDEYAGKAADLEQIAAVRKLVRKILDLTAAHFLEIDGNAPGAGFGHDAVEGDDGNAGIAGLLDRAVQRCREAAFSTIAS